MGRARCDSARLDRVIRGGLIALGLGCVGWIGSSALSLLESQTPGSARSAGSSSSEIREPNGLALESRLATEVAAAEYWASENGNRLQAPNRRHALRSYFEPTGVRVHDRTSDTRGALVALRIAGLGRGERLNPAPPGTVRHERGRVEIDRPTLGLVEWFENSEAGLEHGFTLAVRPTPSNDASDDRSSELVLELSVESATATLRDDAVTLATDAGRTLEYGKLLVVDARGEQLAARFEVPDPDHVRLLVEDEQATYPIVIDPLLTAAADEQIESDQLSGQLGVSVASAGDMNGDGYDDVIVGALLYDLGQTDEGAAFVFLGSAAGIVSSGTPASAAAVFQSDQANAQMGISVASAGDVNGDGFSDVIVGAHRYDNGQTDEGAAFVFLGQALAGPLNGNPATAAAVLESNQASAQLGISVASAGDVDGDGYADVIAGANLYDNVQTNEGAAFVFRGSVTGVASGNPATAAAVLESNQANAQFGISVASAGDVNGDGRADVIAGSPFFDNGLTDEGGAFVFLGSAAGIASGSPTTASATLESNQAFANLGWSVSSAGDVNGDGHADVIVGATGHANGEANEGGAFVFLGSPTGIASGSPATASAVLESNQTLANFGQSVSSAGDVNGDGYADVIVGANLYDNVETSEGAAFVYLGSAVGVVSGITATVSAFLESNQVSAQLGNSVASAGDVNGDGFDDVIVGMRLYDNGQDNEGAILVFHGGVVEPLAQSFGSAQFYPDDFTSLGNSIYFDFGYSEGAGDVNGDGYADVILGVPNLDAGGIFDTGRAYLFHGSPTGISATNLVADTVLESTGAAAEFFGQVATEAGDVNGDGFGDVIVTGNGSAYLYLGSAAGIPSVSAGAANARFDMTQPGSGPIVPVTAGAAGDVNGDGYDDILIGAPFFDSGEAFEGAAFLFLGGAVVADGNPASADARFESNQSGSQLGSSVFTAGDVNGDGFDDIVLNARYYDAGQIDEGAGFLFLGSATGISNGSPATAHVRFESDLASQGWALVRAAGDVNGDGYGDVAVVWPGIDQYLSSSVVATFHGSPAGVPAGHLAAAASTITGFALLTVSALGDFDGDGFDDVIARTGLGGYVFAGSPSGLPSGQSEVVVRHTVNCVGIVACEGAGDVNGDGFADVVSGWARHLGGPPDYSLALDVGITVSHSNTFGRTLLLAQRQNDVSAKLISPGGNLVASSGLRAELLARSPRGRERAKIEVELCPADLPFGDAACTKKSTPNWVDLGLAGAHMSESFTNLAVDARYAWRARTLFTPMSATQPGITPIVRKSPWYRMSRRTGAEDFRTIVPEPGVAGGIGLGAALLASFARRRRPRRSFPDPERMNCGRRIPTVRDWLEKRGMLAGLGALLVLAALPLVARAADGVREINQACVAVGCVTGDTPGFPVTINEPGSYRLTSNLSPAPNINVNAIEIWSPIVSLDLGGFSIIGPTTYGGGPGTCSGGSGIGILAISSVPADSVVVTNGMVRGMGFHAVVLQSSSRVDRVIVERNCGAGITVGFA